MYKNKLLNLIFLLLFLGLTNLVAAEWYVNSTNGNNTAFDGTSAATPFKTIEKAISEAANDDVIHVAAGTYTEATVDMDKDLIFIVDVFQNSQTAILQNGLIIAADVQFDVAGGDFETDDVTLAGGTLSLDSDNLTVVNNGVVTVVDGDINETPVYEGVVDISYQSTADYATGPELPANFNGGDLQIDAPGVTITTSTTFLVVDLDVVNGTLELGVNAEVQGEIDNQDAIDLGGNVLTFDPAAAGANDLGTIANGTFELVGDNDLNIDNPATLPDFVIAAGRTGTATATVDVVVDDFVLNSSTADAFLFGAGGPWTLSVNDDFRRNDNTVGNFDPLTNNGVVEFIGNGDSFFDPGANLTLYDVDINKGAVDAVVTMDASVEVANDASITGGELDLDDYNITMTGNGGTFTNAGQFYTTSGIGYLVFENATGAAPVGVIAGNGIFGNILVDLPVAADDVEVQSSINFSGELFINSGDLEVTGGNTMDFTDDNVAHPTVKINTTGANDASLINNGTVSYTAETSLYYMGTGDYGPGDEWTADPTAIWNLDVRTTNSNEIVGPVAPTTINGALYVAGDDEILNLNSQIATLAADGMAHTVRGIVVGGTLEVEGDGSSITGSTDDDNERTIDDLTVDLAAGESFSLTNLVLITGDVVVNNGTASLTLIDDVTAPTVDANIAGDVTLTDGVLTVTMDDNGNNIDGNVLLTDGTFNLGSDLDVLGTTTHTAATLALDTYNYTMDAAAADYTRNGAGTITSDGGYLVVSNGAGATFTPGANFQVPYLMIDNDPGTDVDLAGGITVTMELWQYTGNIVDNGNDITINGDYNYATGTGAVAGTYTGTGDLVFAGSAITAGANFTCPNIVVNTSGTTYFQTDDTATPTYRVFSTGTFSQEDGNVDLDGNTLLITGGAGDDFVRETDAGLWSMTANGLVQFDDAAFTFDPGTAWSVDNLEILDDATNSTNNDFTVNNMLILTDGVFDADGGVLNLEDGIVVTRNDNAAQLAEAPNYLGMVDLVYSNAGVIVTHNEIPGADVINDFTVNVPIQLDHDITVNGTFTAAALTDATTNGQTVTMADGSTLELQINGAAAFDQELVKPGTLNLIYNGATDTDDFELGATSGGAHPQYNGNITVQQNVDLSSGSLVVNGTFTLDGGSITPSNALGFLGDVTTTSNGGWFANPAAARAVSFMGADNQTFTLNGDQTVPDNVQLTLNKTDNEAYVMLAGGDLDFSGDPTGPATLYFVNGVLVTGDNAVILRHDDDGASPTQGFDRTGVTGTNESHVVGNVSKYLDATGNVYGNNPTVALTRVEFPVGTMPASPPNYRPMSFQFNTIPTANFTLTVNHVDENPEGSNGFPLVDGDLVITNYPDFYWLVTSTVTLQPQVKYDIEAAAAGYTDYEEDGIENVRFVRRFDNNVNNPWIVQGGLGYDNSTNGNVPTVIVRSAEGAISTQGARFTYSQLDKAPVITATPTSPTGVAVVNNTVTINEGDLLTVGFAATDPDIGQDDPAVTLVSLPADDATFENQTLSWQTDGLDAGTYEAVVQATQGGVTTTYTLTIIVTDQNQGPTITNAPSDTTTVIGGTEFTYDFEATDPDPDNQNFTWSIVSGPAGSAIDANGVFTWTPDALLIGQYFDVTVQVADDNNDTDQATFTLWVFENQAPFFTVEIDRDTIFVGETATLVYEAQDPNLDPLTFDFYEEYPDGATLVQNGNTVTFQWTPTTNETAIYVIPIRVSDGELSDSTETRLLVKATTSTLSGTVVYNNTDQGLDNATVTLWQGQTQMATTTSDADGNYSFGNVAPGNYTVTAAKTTGWGGNTAADALLAARFSANDPNVTLNALQEMAADVNNSGSVTNADALTILNRVVGNVTSYTKPDWVFESVDVAVGSTDKGDVDVEGLATGDVNSSLYLPAPLAKEAVTFVNDEALQIAPKATFELPVKVSEGVELGSATLRFEYPADKLSFSGLASKVNAVYNEKDGVVSIAWADVKGYRVSDDGIFAVLEFEATEAFAKKETAEISMLEGELTNTSGELVQAKVSVANVTVAIPETFALSQNYPNPFNPSTTIKYDLPAAGKVSLAIYNSLGQQVANLIDATQEAGSYEIVWNASRLASGVYFYRITVEGAQNYVMTKKMMLLK